MELAIREMLSEVLSEVKATRAGMSEVRDKVTSLEAREAGREREFDRRLAEFADNLRRAEETGEKRLEEFKTENGRRLERLEVENRKLQESAAKNNARWPVVAAIALAVLSLVGSIIQAAISPDPAPHPDHVSAPKP